MDGGSDWVANSGRYSLDFDGSNDYVSSTSLGVNTTSRTVSCWFRTTQVLSDGQYMVVIGWGAASAGAACYVYVGSDSAAGVGPNGFGVTQFGASAGSAVAVNTGNWTHGAMVNQGTTWTTYINGVQVGSKTMTAAPASGATVSIGRWPFGTPLSTNANFAGQLDDIRIYNRIVSVNEIRTLASRRGISYELSPRRRSSSAVQFNRRRRLLVGAH
jgi:hypothetical protein